MLRLIFLTKLQSTTATQLFQEAIGSLCYPRQHTSYGDAGKLSPIHHFSSHFSVNTHIVLNIQLFCLHNL